MYWLLYTASCVLMILDSVHSGSINIKVQGHDADCLYLSKNAGDTMEAMISIASSAENAKINFKVFHPNMKDLIVDVSEVNDYEMAPTKINTTGDYMFCFFNVHSRHPVVVAFEYDFSLEEEQYEDSPEGAKKRMAKEKKNFLLKAVDQIRSTMNPNEASKQTYEQKQHQLWDLLKNNIQSMDNIHTQENQQDKVIKNRLLLLSIYFDRIETYLAIHKTRLRRHHYLQLANNWNVMFYSILICVTIVIAAIVQLVMLKGFINGKMSWKVWKF